MIPIFVVYRGKEQTAEDFVAAFYTKEEAEGCLQLAKERLDEEWTWKEEILANNNQRFFDAWYEKEVR
jgi:hypothetical protein